MDLENEELMADSNLVANVENRGKKCLFLKLLTSKYCNWEAFKATIRCAWHPVKTIRFYDMG